MQIRPRQPRHLRPPPDVGTSIKAAGRPGARRRVRAGREGTGELPPREGHARGRPGHAVRTEPSAPRRSAPGRCSPGPGPVGDVGGRGRRGPRESGPAEGPLAAPWAAPTSGRGCEWEARRGGLWPRGRSSAVAGDNGQEIVQSLFSEQTHSCRNGSAGWRGTRGAGLSGSLSGSWNGGGWVAGWVGRDLPPCPGRARTEPAGARQDSWGSALAGGLLGTWLGKEGFLPSRSARSLSLSCCAARMKSALGPARQKGLFCRWPPTPASWGWVRLCVLEKKFPGSGSSLHRENIPR